MTDIRLMTLDPGHFHAALVQKQSAPGVASLVHVYAPLGPDLAALDAGGISWATFTSSSTARNFIELLGADYKMRLAGVKLATLKALPTASHHPRPYGW